MRRTIRSWPVRRPLPPRETLSLLCPARDTASLARRSGRPKWTYPRRSGWPTIPADTVQLVVRPARGNSTRRYRRIHEELAVMGIDLSTSSVWNILNGTVSDPGQIAQASAGGKRRSSPRVTQPVQVPATDLIGHVEETHNPPEFLSREPIGERRVPVRRHRPPDRLSALLERPRHLYFHTPTIGGVGDAAREASPFQPVDDTSDGTGGEP
jgi:hypothetical protein